MFGTGQTFGHSIRTGKRMADQNTSTW